MRAKPAWVAADEVARREVVEGFTDRWDYEHPFEDTPNFAAIAKLDINGQQAIILLMEMAAKWNEDHKRPTVKWVAPWEANQDTNRLKAAREELKRQTNPLPTL